MINSHGTKENRSDPLFQLVSVALNLTGLKDLSSLLKSIALSMEAYGCVLWEVAPGSDIKASPPKGYLFVLDQWMEDEHPYYFHDLPIYSAAGHTVLYQETLNIGDVEADRHVSADPRYLKRLGVKSLLSVPIIYPDGSRMGAVLFYRKVAGPFSEEEVERGEQLALLVPALYQAIRVKTISNVTRRVEQILNRAKQNTHSHGVPPEAVKILIRRALKNICDFVSATFQCIETSVFLEDPLTSPGAYNLIATTWPERFGKTVYQREQRSLTGWVLSHRKPVRIFDLGNFDRDKRTIQQQYHQLGWTDSLDIKSSVRRILGLEPGAPLPPLSFMAVPIMMGMRVLGVIRCCTAKAGPYYFADADLNLLELVASQISQYWSDWLNELEMQEENRSWGAFTERIGKLNSFVLKELKSATPDERVIFTEALKITGSVIDGAEVMDVRLLDKEKRELYFAAVHGKAWSRGSRAEITERRAHTFPVDETPPTSAGAHVFQTGSVYKIRSVNKMVEGTFYSEKLTFPEVKRMIVAPIKVESDIFGVLDIRGTGRRAFPRNAEAIAELLGRQLGLYHYLATTIGKLHETELDLKAQMDERIRSLEDLAHQIKSPVYQAHERVQNILRGGLADERLDLGMRAVRGLTRKAKRVTHSTMLYASIARKKTIKPKLTKLDSDYMIPMLIEAASDNSLTIEPRRQISIQVDRDSFLVLDTNGVHADRDLLEQAVNNLLDNAGKYSYERTTVEVFGGLTGTNRFHITVCNRGLPIKASEILKCIERGWRSDMATWSTGEGSGIGLWIVNTIMGLHYGELIIIPTDPEDRTEIKLVFPNQK
jgi:signal transduction histidine kinase/GAF domain-containing protein